MLIVTLSEREYYNQKSEEFESFAEEQVELEHSLVSLSKWESKFEKPFLSTSDKTDLEILNYIEFMCLRKIPENFADRLTQANLSDISTYINAKMTATWFSDKPSAPSREIITAELIYYWMFSLNIPMECQYWHLNRLLTLIKVCNLKSQPQKKLSRSEIAARNRELNARRRAQYGTSG